MLRCYYYNCICIFTDALNNCILIRKIHGIYNTCMYISISSIAFE